ncbi:hypothetical protein BC833DRAFT_610595 [Globomyces pollinis-pini]|nr:hypothetical protein BC833DRAFT_610595 [Globomyces pollinis-pini]
MIFGLRKNLLIGRSLTRFLNSKSIPEYPFPWYLSTSKNVNHSLSFWQSIKQKHLVNCGIERAAKNHLNDEYYDFPFRFYDDVVIILHNFFETLSNPNKYDHDHLSTLMTKGLANQFIDGLQLSKSMGQFPKFVLHSQPKVRLRGVHFTYGPYPVPSNYCPQEWDYITIMVPEEDAQFTSYKKNHQLLKEAMDQGCYFRIKATIDCDLEFAIIDSKSDIPLMRDRRKSFDMTFTSPHFTPWDTIFELDEGGKYRLAWDWRISDVDYRLEKQSKESEDTLAKA